MYTNEYKKFVNGVTFNDNYKTNGNLEFYNEKSFCSFLDKQITMFESDLPKSKKQGCCLNFATYWADFLNGKFAYVPEWNEERKINELHCFVVFEQNGKTYCCDPARDVMEGNFENPKYYVVPIENFEYKGKTIKDSTIFKNIIYSNIPILPATKSEEKIFDFEK